MALRVATPMDTCQATNGAFMLSLQKQEKLKENKGKLTPDDKRNLVNAFALLIKVDKRINPHLYKNKREKND